MFHEEIVGYEGIFSELYFDSNPVFNEICLVVAKDCRFPGGFDFLFLLLSRHRESFSDQFLALGNPVTNAALAPMLFPE